MLAGTEGGKRMAIFLTLFVLLQGVTATSRQIPVAGRVTVEDGGLLPRASLIVDGDMRIDLGILEPDGSFTIRIPEGEHRLSAQVRSGPYRVKSMTFGSSDPRQLPVTISETSPRSLLITFEATGLSPWRKVSGRLQLSPDAAPVPHQVLLAGPFVQNVETTAGPDGSFEFPKVPPGQYSAFLQPINLFAAAAEFVVAEKDVTGVELKPPQVIEIAVRVLTEDGNATATESIVILAQTAREIRGLSGMVEGVATDKRLAVQLLHGEWRLTTVRLPPGFYVRSMTHGGTDLLRQALSVDGGPGGPIEMTLARFDPKSIAGVRIGGRVRMPSAEGTPRPTKVSLSAVDNGGRTFETSINADASFEFSSIPPGSYDARLIGEEIPAAIQQYRSRVVVEKNDRSDVQLTAVVWSQVTGRVIVDGGAPLPQFKENSTGVQFGQDSGFAIGDDIRPDGSFEMALVRGDYQVSLLNLPAPYYVKSISSLESEIRQGRLPHDGSRPRTLTITLGMRPVP
jgi:hypothetical protein